MKNRRLLSCTTLALLALAVTTSVVAENYTCSWSQGKVFSSINEAVSATRNYTFNQWCGEGDAWISGSNTSTNQQGTVTISTSVEVNGNCNGYTKVYTCSPVTNSK